MHKVKSGHAGPAPPPPSRKRGGIRLMYLQLRCLTRMPSRPLAIWILPIFLAAPGFKAFAGPDSKPKAEARHATPPKPAGFAAIGLPHYAAPDAYREDLVIENEGKAITMKRFVDHGRSRTEMASEGHSFVMLEMGEDKGTGAPGRMESLVDGKKAIIEWKNRKVEAQPAELFAVPKGYEVTDMDEMMKKMGSMGGGGLPMGGMGVGSMAKGMAGGMAQGMAQGFGANL